MTTLLMKLARSRTFWRFLVLLAGALGATAITQDLSGLETLVCSVLTCSD